MISIRNLLVIAGKCTPKTIPRTRARMARKLQFGEVTRPPRLKEAAKRKKEDALDSVNSMTNE